VRETLWHYVFARLAVWRCADSSSSQSCGSFTAKKKAARDRGRNGHRLRLSDCDDSLYFRPDQTVVFAAKLLLRVRKNCLSISRIFTALLRIETEQILQFDGEYRREFGHKWRKVSRTLRAPTDKALCQSFVGVAGTPIEKHHCFPAARFCFKERQQMDRDDRVPITHHGVPA
jgi:hypothetical protein